MAQSANDHVPETFQCLASQKKSFETHHVQSLLLPVFLCAHLTPTATAEPAIAPSPRPVRVDGEGIRLPPDALCRLGSARFRHPAPVDYLAFAPDGRTIAVAHVGGITIWETATGRPTRRIEWHSGRINRITFAADARTVHVIAETAPHKWSLVSFDVSTGIEQHRVAIQENFVPFPLVPGWVGGSFASRKVTLFDPASGKELAHVSKLPGTIVGFSPDGQRIALSVGGGIFLIVDVLTGEQVEKVSLKGFKADAVWPLPDGSGGTRLERSSSGIGNTTKVSFCLATGNCWQSIATARR